VGSVNAQPHCDVVSTRPPPGDVVLGRGGYSLSSRALFLIYPQLPSLQRQYVRLGALPCPLDAVQDAGVIVVVRCPTDLRQAHVRTHHASDGPAQMPLLNQDPRPPGGEQKPRRQVELAADQLHNLLIGEPVNAGAPIPDKAVIFYLILLASAVDNSRFLH